MKNYLYFFIFITITLPVFGQQYDLSYHEVKQLGDISNRANVSTGLLREVGTAHFYNAEYDKAYTHFRRLFSDENDIQIRDHYFYGQCLKVMGEYDLAQQYLNDYAKQKHLSYALIDSDFYLEKIKEQSGRYTLQGITVNSEMSEFPTIADSSKVFFLSNRKGGKYDEELDGLTYNLWESSVVAHGNWGEETQVNEVNGRLNEGNCTIASNGKFAFVTQNDPKTYQLKVYRALWNDGEWKVGDPVHFCSDVYSVAQPVLSRDNSKLYFVSDMPGGYGETDIYAVDVYSDGKVGNPKNLGSNVNTLGRENFPFAAADDQLYFASTGHNTLGGFDVFTAIYDEESERYDMAINVGQPINTIHDDFGYILYSENEGYFASNREGGKGADDIYAFIEHTSLRGLDDELSEEVDSPCLDTIGLPVITVVDGELYTTDDLINTGEYFIVPKDIDTVPAISPEEIVVIDPGVSLNELLSLENIYFDLNSSYLRKDAKKDLDVIVSFMKDNPEVRVVLAAHTDQRGTDHYNLWLSERRGKRAIDYLINHGIDSQRFSSDAFGETKLVNRCPNNDCDEDIHAPNRRVEFVVVK